MIKHSAIEMVELLKYILDLSKIQSKKERLNEENVDVCEISQEVVYLFQSLANEKGVEIDKNVQITSLLKCLWMDISTGKFYSI